MTDEHSIHLGQALTGGTITARILIFSRNYFEKRVRTRTTWRAQTVTNVEEMSTLVKKDL
jgi:hypothetical protein